MTTVSGISQGEPVEVGVHVTVTFLFTDIEGSTELWEREPAAMELALARHDLLVREAIERQRGTVFKALGDAFCAVFAAAPDALAAALAAQRALVAEAWPTATPIRVRMAIHSGSAERRGDDWFGPPLNRVARMLDAGHGGQILLSQAAQALVADRFPEGAALVDMGERMLKDLARAERLFQLVTADLPSEFPPLRTLDARPHNLPLSPTPLVGREREIAEIRDLVLRERARLVTLVGPGGTGKTRLALQAAADMVDAFRDGVYLVNFAPVQDPAVVPSQILQALGQKADGDGAAEEALRAALRDRETLLLLDNFEQLVAAAPVVGSVLRDTAGTFFLVTSQAALHVRGEREYPVAPLDPDDSVTLFVQRARAAVPSFELTGENEAAVREIVRQLDGLPLAIELSAARVKMFPPPALLARLRRGYDFLTGGARDAPDRHRTLRAAIEWSYDLLSEEDRALFHRQAVFDGGFTLEAAEAVVSAPEAELDVLAGLESLLDKSLLRQVGTADGEPRFERLRTIRAFAVERLEASGEADRWRRRHAEWFAEFAAGFERGGTPSVEAREFLARLERELDNLRAAFRWAIGKGEASLAIRLASVLPVIWFLRGDSEEMTRWVERIFDLQDVLSPRERAQALTLRARLAQVLGDNSLAVVRDIEESLALFREVGDESGVARALMSLGNTHRRLGAYDEAERLFQESLGIYRRLGDPANEGGALLNLADLHSARGDLDHARASLDQAVALARRMSNPVMLGYALGYVGSLAYQEGRLEDAERHLTESLEAFRSVGGGEISQAWMIGGIGSVTRERGELAVARERFAEALAIFRERDYRPGLAYVLLGFASLATLEGDSEAAARLLGAGEAIAREAYIAPTPSELAAREIAGKARETLGDEAFERLRGEGAALPLAEALALLPAAPAAVGGHRPGRRT